MMALRLSMVFLLGFVGMMVGGAGAAALEGKEVPWLEEYTPTEEQVEFNYTKVETVDGYRCEFDFENSNQTVQVLYLEKENIEDLTGCEPAKWKQRSANCDRKNTASNLCKEGRVNTDLANLKLDGTQSCVDASNAINMKYEGATNEMQEEGGEGSGRRLNWCASRTGACRHYYHTCSTTKEILFNWHYTGLTSSGQHDDLFFHHHGWQMQDNVKGWGNAGSNDFMETDIGCLGKHRRARIGAGHPRDVYEGNYLYQCTCMTAGEVHTRGLQTGNLLFDTNQAIQVHPSNMCSRKRQNNKWSFGGPSECEINVTWRGTVNNGNYGAKNTIAGSGWQ